MDVEHGQGQGDLVRPARHRPVRLNTMTMTPENDALGADQPRLPSASSASDAGDPARSASTENTGETSADPSRPSTPGGWSSVFRTPSHRQRSAVMESTPLVQMRDYFMLPPEDSVYSYFMFVPPVDQRRTKKHITPLIFFASILVAVNFAMQVTLLTVVGNHIMHEHNEWMSSMVRVKNFAWYHIFPMPYNAPPPVCRGQDKSLCSDTGDGLSCSPPSARVLSNWDLLDTDGDGVWSRAEAEDKHLQEAILCDFGADLLSLYHNVARQLNASHALKGRRNADLFSGNSVHKAYFDWYMHKPLLCQYGDADMCGPLFQWGFFDEALLQQTSPEFEDVSLALTYCTHLLRHECYKIMPSTYTVWRSRSEKQCGSKVYGQSMYTPPEIQGNAIETISSSVPMLTVNFKMQTTYEHTKTIPFRIFLWVLIITFLSVMFLEMRSIYKTLAWTYTFPADTQEHGLDGNIVGQDAVRIEVDGNDHVGVDEDGKKYHVASAKSIHAIRTDHRVSVIVVTVMRMTLWFLLLWSGVMFLTGQPRYLSLIFDALSLVFIFEIDELLYRTMLRHEFKVDHMTIADMRVRNLQGGSLSGQKSVLNDIFMFLGIILFGSCIVYTCCTVEFDPIIDALSCLCSKDGPRCLDTQQFGKTWWDNYWSSTFPAANLIIDRLANA